MYKKYELRFDGIEYYVFRPRPYDDADYYELKSKDKKKWQIYFKNKIVEEKDGTFEELVDYIEFLNLEIKSKMCHN